MFLASRWSGKSLRDVRAQSINAESLGADIFMTMENAHEPFMPLALAAEHTKNLQLWTGIAISFNRSPMVTANTAFDLQEASGGRFVLGLGPQVKGHNERRFSVPWTPPVPRMREYIASLRAIWRCWELNEKLNFRGNHYRFDLMTPNFSPPPSKQPMVPITLAAVGPAMIKLAGELSDGVQLHPFCTRKYFDNVVKPELERGMEAGGQSRENLCLSGGGFLVTGPDSETVARLSEFVRYRVAFYGSTRTYWPVLEQHDLLDLGAKLHDLARRGLWDEMAKEIDDDVLRLFAVIGTHDEVLPQIGERFGGQIDLIMPMSSPSDDPKVTGDWVRSVHEMSVPFKGFVDRWGSKELP